MTEKMTQKEMFRHIMEIVSEEEHEVIEFCKARIEQLEKPRAKKENTEAIEFAAGVATYMADYGEPDGFEGFTNKELAEHFEVSSQKMSAALRRLVNEGAVVRIEGKPVRFKLAENVEVEAEVESF